MTATHKDFYFLSEFLARKLYHPDGSCLGRVVDLVAEKVEPYPVVTGLMVRRGVRGPRAFLPWSAVSRIDPHLTFSPDSIQRSEVPEHGGKMVFLREEVLDKQIVDTFGAKVVRVNDVKLTEEGGAAYVTDVDVGMRGILRRLGVERRGGAFFETIRHPLHHQLISWQYLQPLESRLDRLTLSVSREAVSDLHPADLAQIMSDLAPEERQDFFEKLDTETAAEALHELEPDVQADLISEMDKEQAADIIEQMPPDEAADVIADLPTEKAQELLQKALAINPHYVQAHLLQAGVERTGHPAPQVVERREDRLLVRHRHANPGQVAPAPEPAYQGRQICRGDVARDGHHIEAPLAECAVERRGRPHVCRWMRQMHPHAAPPRDLLASHFPHPFTGGARCLASQSVFR